MTSAQHAEGRQFDPGQVYFYSTRCVLQLNSRVCVCVCVHLVERSACVSADLSEEVLVLFVCIRKNKVGLLRELNPGPLAP